MLSCGVEGFVKRTLARAGSLESRRKILPGDFRACALRSSVLESRRKILPGDFRACALRSSVAVRRKAPCRLAAGSHALEFDMLADDSADVARVLADLLCRFDGLHVGHAVGDRG